MGRWASRGVAFALFLAIALLAPTGFGQDEDGFHRDLYRCRNLLKRGKWKDAAAAYRALFTNYENDRRIVTKLRDIEDGLMRALFKSVYRSPKGKDLFGDAAVTFSIPTRKVKLSYGSKLPPPLWKDHGRGVRLLNVRFEGTLKLAVEARARVREGSRPLVVAFCFDPARQTGYAVS
ncbi:MAG: hypothetical protein ACYTDY_08420, partial [Planctomycetota bacterium]